jgi:mannose-6-phosphate isomerase-like protein (cupin superfamily)
MVRSKASVPPAIWGQECKAWELLASADLSIKHEHMPAGTQEVRHRHARAQQFFFVLSGVLTLELSGHQHELAAHEGLPVPPGENHQAINTGDDPVEFLVISSPSTFRGRIETS